MLPALPRGTGPLGFYEKAGDRLGIVRVRLASELAPAERPLIEVLRTDSPSFTAWVQARANRKDDFFIRPAGALDICNALPPVRVVSGLGRPRAAITAHLSAPASPIHSGGT